MKLVKRHLILEEGPAEFRFVVDERDFGDRFDGYSMAISVGGKEGKKKKKRDGPPAKASNFLGTASVDFLSSSSRAGEMVKKSTPANALISPVCWDNGDQPMGIDGTRIRWVRTLRKLAPMTMVL